MDISKVKEFIDLAKDEGVAELKCETKDLKISVSFNHGASPQAFVVPPVSNHPMAAGDTGVSKDEEAGLISVTSPFVGTFYDSASPDKDAYVSIGAKVSKGTTLCILEAMKIMNEIESEVSGEVVEICVDNESLVEFGQTLFKIRA